MWKDLFYLTKREKAAVWTLTVLVVLAQALIWSKAWWLPRLTVALGIGVVSDSLQQAGLVKKDSEALTYDAVSGPEAENRTRQFQTRNDEPLKPFNPNQADSLTLRRAGLSAKVTFNLLKYRRKGGTFRKPADVAKIYGMTPETMARINASLVFDTPMAVKPVNAVEAVNSGKAVNSGITVYEGMTGNATKTVNRETVIEVVKPVDPVHTTPSAQGSIAATSVSKAEKPSEASAGVFELNTADTAQLQCLKGVGPVTADRIIRYRQQLGGYYHVAQLAEIKGLYPDVLARLQASLTVDPAHISKINLNKASLEKLKAHPYLSFYQAKVIVELRKARKGLKNVDELAVFKEFSPTDLERLKWYVTW